MALVAKAPFAKKLIMGRWQMKGSGLSSSLTHQCDAFCLERDGILQLQYFLLDGLPPLLNGLDWGSVRSLVLRSGIQRLGLRKGSFFYCCCCCCVCMFFCFHQLFGAWLGSTLPEWSNSALSQSESSYRPWFHRKTKLAGEYRAVISIRHNFKSLCPAPLKLRSLPRSCGRCWPAAS